MKALFSILVAWMLCGAVAAFFEQMPVRRTAGDAWVVERLAP